MILNSYFYPDKQWLGFPHRVEPTGDYEKDKYSDEMIFTGDYEGHIPFAFIQGNREAGKSVGVGIFLIADFLLYGYESVLVRRYATDFTNKDAMRSFWMKSWPYRGEFPNVIKHHPELQKMYPLDLVNSFDWTNHEIAFKNSIAYVDGKPMCYDASLYGEGPTNFKQRVFHNVFKIIYDEYIPELGTDTIPGELKRFYNIVETAARGRKDAKKTFGCIFISNTVTDDNIWAKAYDFKSRIRKDSKYVVFDDKKISVEKVHNKAVAAEFKESDLGQCIMATEDGQAYVNYAQDNEAQDNLEFVEKLSSPDMKYMCNLKYDNATYAMKYDIRNMLYYFTDEGVDYEYKNAYALTKDDHALNTVFISTTLKKRFISVKLAYASGQMRFSSIMAKNIFMDIYPLL